MSEMLVFFIGLFVGAPIGLLITSLLASGKTEDMMSEITDLRTQRQLLKEEIFRLSKPKAKPTPRRRRTKKK
jgi:hypothetical protein|tara:strand:- start:81 stop:296 length:216 start_codon:yes stop_codon:yes gene_type:complete